jgi:hypothetical protein
MVDAGFETYKVGKPEYTGTLQGQKSRFHFLLGEKEFIAIFAIYHRLPFEISENNYC